jgi:hypothetical protein
LRRSVCLGAGSAAAELGRSGIPACYNLEVEARMSTDISIETMSVAEKVRLLESGLPWKS